MAAALATGGSQSAYAPSCKYCRHGVEPKWLQAITSNEVKQYEDATVRRAVVVLLGCDPTARVRRCDGAMRRDCHSTTMIPRTLATVRRCDGARARYPTVVLGKSAILRTLAMVRRCDGATVTVRRATGATVRRAAPLWC